MLIKIVKIGTEECCCAVLTELFRMPKSVNNNQTNKKVPKYNIFKYIIFVKLFENKTVAKEDLMKRYLTD